MKKIIWILSFLFAGAIVLHAAYVNTELLYEASFSSADSLKAWKDSRAAEFLPGGGPAKTGAILFRLPEEGTRWMSIGLDPAKVNGLVQLEAVVRGRNLIPGPKPYLGSKVMLAFEQNGRMRHPEPPRRFGTYDWMTMRLVTMIPADTPTLTLSLGIQQAAGEFEVESIRIFRCVETDDPGIGKPAVNSAAPAIPRGPGKGAKYRGVMSGNDMSPEAFAELEKWGANLIRYQMRPGNFNPRPDISSREKYLSWIDSEIERIDGLLPLFRKHNIKIVIDLHAGPGTEINKVASNILGKNTSLETLEEAWRKLARRYRNEPLIYGYDLLNEPVGDDYLKSADPWADISERLVKAIREIDPDTPIITEPDFTRIRPIAGKNIIYSPHFYSPHSYTHQGVLGQVRWSYPGVIDGVYWDKEQLRVSMKDAIEFQKKYNVPIFVGEFSVINWAKGGDRYLKDMIELFEEYGWDWTYHAFREYPGWSVEHEGIDWHKIVPSADNPRKQVLLEALGRNRTE